MGAAHDCSAAAGALAWLIRGGNVIVIPELGSALHAKENVVALSLTLSSDELQTTDTAHRGTNEGPRVRNFVGTPLRRLCNGSPAGCLRSALTR